MSKAKVSAAPAAPSSDGIGRLLEQYGCGPIAFTGTDDALYERHVIFDHIARLRAPFIMNFMLLVPLAS
jgi:glycogen phosphorylase